MLSKTLAKLGNVLIGCSSVTEGCALGAIAPPSRKKFPVFYQYNQTDRPLVTVSRFAVFIGLVTLYDDYFY